jgi:peptide/nickel transport system substrate-binding protein
MSHGLTAIALLLAVTLGGPYAAADTPAKTLVVAGTLGDIISLDPAEAYEAGGGEIIANTYDRLIRYEADDLTHLVGGVAQSWTVSDDGKTFTFALRHGLRFANGDPISAEDVAFSLRRVVMLDKTPSFLLTQFGWTPANVDSLVHATAPDTFQFTVIADLAPTLVLNVISSTIGSVVDQKVALSHQNGGDLGNAWLKSHTAGSGAFTLRIWKPDESVVLDANPDYRLGAPTLQHVVIRHVPDPATQRLLLEKGDADIARNLTGDQVAGLSNNPDIVVTAHPSVNTYYVALNQSDPRLANPKVREALHYLIDDGGMIATLLKGQFRIDQSFLPQGIWSAEQLEPYHFDVARAKSLLAEAGYPNGFDVSMDVFSEAPWTQIAQSLQATMAQAGVRVTLLTAEDKQVWTRFRARQHQMLLIMWSPDYLDPHSNAEAFARNMDDSDASKSRTVAWRNHWSDPAMSAQVDAGMRERDPAKRELIYRTLQQEVLATGPYLVMFQPTIQVARRRNVNGFVLGPYWDLVFYRETTK